VAALREDFKNAGRRRSESDVVHPANSPSKSQAGTMLAGARATTNAAGGGGNVRGEPLADRKSKSSPQHFFPNSPTLSKDTTNSLQPPPIAKTSPFSSPFAFFMGNKDKDRETVAQARHDIIASEPAMKFVPIKASSILAGPLTAALGVAWLDKRCDSLVLLTARRSSYCLEFISRWVPKLSCERDTA
jgi:hypothetical protein